MLLRCCTLRHPRAISQASQRPRGAKWTANGGAFEGFLLSGKHGVGKRGTEESGFCSWLQSGKHENQQFTKHCL